MKVSVKWLGHASFLIKVNGKNIYIDPFEGEYREKADVILVTHSHHDHCDPSKLMQVRTEDSVIIATADCASKIDGEIKTLKPGEKTAIKKGTVEAVEAYNTKRFRSPGSPYHPKGLGVGYLITIGNKTIYHTGDTDFIPEMKQLRNIHLMLVPCGDTFTMDINDAAEAVLTIQPEVVIPMHTREADTEILKERVENRSHIKVAILKPGEQLNIP